MDIDKNKDEWLDAMRIINQWSKITYKCEASDVVAYVKYLTSEIDQLKRKLYYKKEYIDPYRHLESFDLEEDERPY